MNLMTTSSPHIRSKDTTGRIMLDVLIALVPTLAAGTIIFGVRALLVALVSMASAIVAEAVFSLILGRGFTVKDGSAAVTGLLLALTLPPMAPLYLPVIGSFFAIVVVKQLYGGIGKNFLTPLWQAALCCWLPMLSLWAPTPCPTQWAVWMQLPCPLLSASSTAAAPK